MKILVTSYISSDIDGVACAIAYSEYLNTLKNGNSYDYGFSTEVQVEAKYVLEKLGVNYKSFNEATNYDGYILVDHSELFDLPKFVDKDKVIEVIDHRAFPDYKGFPNAHFQIELVGAAATMIAEKYMFGKIPLTDNTAKLLLCGIYSNTINFQSDTKTLRDERVRDWLLSKLKGDNTFVFEMFEYKSKYMLDNLKETLAADLKEIKVDDITITLLQLELLNSEKVFTRLGELKDIMKGFSLTFCYLILQDISKAITYIYSPDKHGFDIFRTKGLDGFVNSDGIWEIPHIVMRKTICKKLLA